MTTTNDTLDFQPDADLVEVAQLTGEIFADLASVDRVREVEAEGGHDERLWKTLADAGAFGLALPGQVGGMGMGMCALIAMLEQQGRRVAPVRLGASITGALMPLAHFGTEDQRARWLTPALQGDHVLTTALLVDARGGVLRAAATRAGSEWSLRGDFSPVPAAPVAHAVLVPVEVDGRPGLAVVPTDTDGVRIEPVAVTDRGSSGRVRLDDVIVPDDAILPALDGEDPATWALLRARIAAAGLLAGVCREALSITAAYTSERHQFGRPLSSNQAVAVRAADAHLDSEAIRLTALRAAWLLDGGAPDPEVTSAGVVAAWWASTGGLRVLHATQHLHGGMGADVDYPIHRYFLWGRQIAYDLGSAGTLAAELGDLLPTAPPVGGAG